jgi:O-antigen/teichoic acid export membrane protein
VRDSVHTFLIRVLNAVIAAALGILTARVLGPALRGIYVLPILDAALASALFGGLGSATSYYMLSERRGRGILRPAFLTALLFVTLGVLSVSALGLAQHRAWTILPAAVALPPMALTAIVTGYCLGINRVRYANYLTTFISLTGLVMIALGLLLISRSAAVAIEMWVASLVVTAAGAGLFLLNSSWKLRGSPVAVTEYMLFAAKSGFTNLVTILNLRIDVYIIAALTSSATLGTYTIAVAGADTLKILTQVLSQTAGPRIGSASLSESAQFTAKCVRNNLLIALVPCAMTLIAAPWIVALLYGQRFLGSVSPLQILSVGIFASAPASILSTFYTLRLGRPMVSFWNNAFSAAICCGLSFVLIPTFGMLGAAWASTLAYIVSQVHFLWLFTRTTLLPITSVLFVQRNDLQRLQRVVTTILQRFRNARTA